MWPHGQSEAEPNAAVVRGSAPTAQDGSTTDKSGGGGRTCCQRCHPSDTGKPGAARTGTDSYTGAHRPSVRTAEKGLALRSRSSSGTLAPRISTWKNLYCLCPALPAGSGQLHRAGAGRGGPYTAQAAAPVRTAVRPPPPTGLPGRAARRQARP